MVVKAEGPPPTGRRSCSDRLCECECECECEEEEELVSGLGYV